MAVHTDTPRVLCGVDEQSDCASCGAESTPRNPVFRVAIVGEGIVRRCQSCLHDENAGGE